jgi:CheY-like chemotaxis protein
LNLESESGQAVSGFELCDRIVETLASRSAPQPAFIFMTGDLVDAAISQQANHQGSRFLQKPFRMADLLAMLAELPTTSSVLQPKNNLS